MGQEFGPTKLYLPEAVYEKIDIEAVSGDVSLERGISAARLNVKTVSGDVNAKLLSEKEITTSTVSGDVSVPNNRQGASPCQVETVSGDIRVETP